jgi:hypothetical protein
MGASAVSNIDLVVRRENDKLRVVKPGTDWAISKQYGETGERAFAHALLADTQIVTIEHKRDRWCQHSGMIFVEFDQRTGPSGISVSRADRWAFELLDGCWLLVPTKRLIDVHNVAVDMGLVKDGGDFGNRGSRFPPCWLIRAPHNTGDCKLPTLHKEKLTA